ncbi:MAG: YihY/virulence factor BrkB family protein [Paracoccaceae bacterium]
MTEAAGSETAEAGAGGAAEETSARESAAVRHSRTLWFAARVAGSAAASFAKDEGWMLSGYIAYSALLAVFPFLIFATSLAASTVGPGEIEALVDLLFDVAPPEVASEIEPALRNVLETKREGVLTVSALGALIVASNGVEAFRQAFDRAYYASKPRGAILGRLIGLVVVMVGTVAAIVLGFAVVLAPLIIRLVEGWFGIETPFGIGIARYALAGLTLFLFLALMHMTLPTRPPGFRRALPGVLTTLALWTIGAVGFSWYLAAAPDYSATYGSLAGVIVTLLFFFLSGAVIIYGAEVNAAIDRLKGRAPRPGRTAPPAKERAEA